MKKSDPQAAAESIVTMVSPYKENYKIFQKLITKFQLLKNYLHIYLQFWRVCSKLSSKICRQVLQFTTTYHKNGSVSTTSFNN